MAWLVYQSVLQTPPTYRIYTAPPHGVQGDGKARAQRAQNIKGGCTKRTSAICILRTL